ncbi:MAG: hypothetical protein ABEN55_15765 [Bradymonadaceae bacterium]
MSDRFTHGRSRRGSALIIVLLVLLALSALGMVALQSVGDTLDRTGTYRVRSNADVFSASAARFFVGDLKRYAGKLSKASRQKISGASGNQRRRFGQMGGYIRLKQQSSVGSGSATRDFEQLSSGVGDNESGLFTGGSNESFEQKNAQSSFEIVVRNPSSPMERPGYSGNYCFRKVTVAAQGRLGKLDSSWNAPAQVGQARTSVEGFVPVSQCSK